MTSQLKISDETYALLEPHLHDGSLLSINLQSSISVELLVADLSGDKYVISLEGVAQFQATNFREGNIILDVTITPADKIRMVELKPLVQASETTPQFGTELKAIYDRATNESLQVIEVNPSYGCHVIGVVKTIRIDPEARTAKGDREKFAQI